MKYRYAHRLELINNHLPRSHVSGSIFLRISWPETRAFSQAQRFASWLQRLLRKSHEKYFQSKQVVFSFFHCHGLFCALGSVFSWPGPTGWPRPEGEEGVSDSRYETLCWHLSNNDKKVFYKLRKNSPGFDKVQLSFKSAILCLVAKVTIKLICLNWGWHDKFNNRTLSVCEVNTLSFESVWSGRIFTRGTRKLRMHQI